jgi:hypothetical protein
MVSTLVDEEIPTNLRKIEKQYPQPKSLEVSSPEQVTQDITKGFNDAD